MKRFENIDILYEDNHIMVVQKPEGVLSQEDETKDEDMLTILKRYIKEAYQKPGNVYLGLVHRLDRRVSGVMVFAKSSKAASRLSEDIREHCFHKVYIAIVYGYLDGSGEINTFIKKDNIKAVIAEDGNLSTLKYDVINHFEIGKDSYSVLKIDLITGKYNQIRMQLESIGHPIINDFKYHYRGPKYGDTLGLRCVKLSFKHPITKELMVFTSPPIYKTGWEKYLEEINE